MTVKLTALRQNVLDTINGSSDVLSAKKIWEMLNREPNLTSIYRTADFLEENDLILSISISGIKYLVSKTNRDHGHFVICRECSEIIRFSDCAISDLQKKIQNRLNYTITSHVLYFEGYCRECSSALEKKLKNGEIL